MALTELAQPATPTGVLVVSVSNDGSTAVVTLRGEADLCTLPLVVDVLARVIADTDDGIAIDLAQTEFIDTATVRVLVRACRFLDDRGRRLTLRSPSRPAARVLGLLGLADLIERGGCRMTEVLPLDPAGVRGATSGIDINGLQPPHGGRPGWGAGVTIAQRASPERTPAPA